MIYRSASVTHQGKVRTRNEDAFYADDSAGVWLVADGMGGHAGGDVASQLAIDSICLALGNGQSLEAAIESAHQTILQRSQIEPELTGMGSTVVAVQVHQRQLQLAWVGDSRIYLLESGVLKQLSVDHSFVQDMVLRGVLTEEEAQHHPQRNLLRQALGQTNLQRLQVDSLQITLKAGQRLLLCSDGVHDMLGSHQLEAILSSGADEEPIRALEEAVMATEASDNFTGIIITGMRQSLSAWTKRFFRTKSEKDPAL